LPVLLVQAIDEFFNGYSSTHERSAKTRVAYRSDLDQVAAFAGTVVDPLNGAMGLPTNAVIRLQFSERINPLTVNNATFLIVASSSNVAVTGTVSLTSDGLSASFAPGAALAPSTTYFVEAFGITDLTGQEINFFFTSFITGSNNASLTREPRGQNLKLSRTLSRNTND
jgi:Big-like domain-containing protein